MTFVLPALALLTALTTMTGGLMALRLKAHLPLALGFSAGAVTGVALFDLLPQALALAGGAGQLTVGAAALGFFLYAGIDRFAGHDHDCHGTPHRGAMGAASFSLHSLLDGLAMGLAFRASPHVGLMVAAAVLAHDFADGLNTVNVVMRHGESRGAALRWLAADALAPLAGVGLSFLLAPTAAVLSLVLAGFGGFFLYIGACDLLPASQKARPGLVTLMATAAGAAFLYFVTRLAP
jgi:ZIP family zinc transporter